MAKYQLNVIFHGPFIFVVYSDRVEVFSPDIEDHNFGAGNWKQETPCNHGIYTLQGITGPPGQMQGLKTEPLVILDHTKLPKMGVPQRADYRFVLKPLPASIMALGLLDPTKPRPVFFTGADVGNVTVPPILGTAHLFTFVVNQSDKLQLSGSRWAPDSFRKISPDFYATNLHIFSEAVFDMGAVHPGHDFDQIATLLPGLLLDLADPFPEIEFVKNPNAPAQGIEDEEQGGLRGLPPKTKITLVPPRICDTPSLVITNPG
jgi:hypothetical protein